MNNNTATAAGSSAAAPGDAAVQRKNKRPKCKDLDEIYWGFRCPCVEFNWVYRKLG